MYETQNNTIINLHQLEMAEYISKWNELAIIVAQWDHTVTRADRLDHDWIVRQSLAAMGIEDNYKKCPLISAMWDAKPNRTY